MPDEPQTIIDRCLDHLAISQNNEFFFLLKLYKSKRFVLFNCLMNFRLETTSQQFYNTQEMTRVLKELKEEGYPIKKATLRALSPYRTEHINRFGYYSLKMNQKVPPLITDFQLFV